MAWHGRPTRRDPVPATSLVATGPDGAREPACAACKASDQPRTVASIEGIAMMLCDDFGQCAARYRAGRTPAQYARSLRAEARA